jgi:hypothetical protein
MSLLKKFLKLFALPSPVAANMMIVTVRCSKCSEVIQTRINLSNDLSVEYGDVEADTRYTCRKVLVGEARCYQPVEVILTFDQNRKLIDRKVKGGTFVEE